LPPAVQKADARPGGYVATGGHVGILGAVDHDGPPLLHYLPTAKHTWRGQPDAPAGRNSGRSPGGRRHRHGAGSPIRTLTVPFSRLASGTMPMTEAGIVQSGYASSTAETGMPG
jgi:hypothetical protein